MIHRPPSASVHDELYAALRAEIGRWNLPQSAAATRLGLARPALNALIRGQRRPSLAKLLDLADRSGLCVTVAIVSDPAAMSFPARPPAPRAKAMAGSAALL